MDRREHLDACLQVHKDLLDLEREVNDWLKGLTDVAWDDGRLEGRSTWREDRHERTARRPERPARNGQRRQEWQRAR